MLELIEAHDLVGLAGILMHDGDDDGLVIWWNGDPPEALGQLVRGCPMRVTFRSSPFSQSEINPVVPRLAASVMPFRAVSFSHDVTCGKTHLGVVSDEVDIAREHVRTHDSADVDGVPVPIMVEACEPATAV